MTPNKPEQLADAPLELLQRPITACCICPTSAASRAAQQGLLFLLSKLERYNVRLVCSCSRPLQELLVDPACDNRLLTALSSVIVPIPSLREHADDIVELAQQLWPS